MNKPALLAKVPVRLWVQFIGLKTRMLNKPLIGLSGQSASGRFANAHHHID